MMDYSASSTIAVAQSRRFAFYNICRIRYFLTKDETQLLVEVLVISHLVYCNCWTVGLPASMTKSLQRIQNAAVCLVFNLPKFSCVNPFLCDLHWLPVVDRIQFENDGADLQGCNGSAPIYLRPHAPAWALRSTTSAGWLVPPLLSTKLRHFSVLLLQWWNELPTNVRTAESFAVFPKRLKTHLLTSTLHSMNPSLSDRDCNVVCGNTHLMSLNTHLKLIQYKWLMQTHTNVTPVDLNQYNENIPDMCTKCMETTGTLFHVFVTAEGFKNFGRR